MLRHILMTALIGEDEKEDIFTVEWYQCVNIKIALLVFFVKSIVMGSKTTMGLFGNGN